jgi:hypothetical protein
MTQGVLLLALVIALLTSCQRREPTSGAGTLRSDWGVVLPAAEQPEMLKSCSRASPRGLTGHWMPARAGIDQLERRLPAVLEMALSQVTLKSGETRPMATDYYRQYGGFYRAGRRVVYVNGLHQRVVPTRESPSWTEKPFGVCDGGLMGFAVVYDVDADNFEDVEFDGRVSGPTKTTDSPARRGERVASPTFDGVVMAHPEPGGWVPTYQQIAELEAALPAYSSAELRRLNITLSRRLAQYKRQYLGRAEGGKRTIHVTFLHNEADEVKSGEWLDRPVTVLGGGDRFLYAEYDADSKRFLSFVVNSQR